MGLFSEFASTQNVQVHALLAGWAHLPDKWLFEDGDDDIMKSQVRFPSYSFLISHPSGKKILFDAGFSKTHQDDMPGPNRAYSHVYNIQISKDVRDLLSEGPVSPDSINAIVLSHLHFDHIGDPSTFPDTPYVTGPGTKAAAAPGWPFDQNSTMPGPLLARDNFTELSWTNDKWTSLGPFSHAHDYFGDGSFYIIDTPGHLPGHVTGLAQTGPDEWVLLGGDCCHHRTLLDGSRQMSVNGCPGGTSMHVDLEVATKSVERIRKLDQDDTVFVALSHDGTLEGKMPEYPTALNGWKESAWWDSMRKERKQALSS